jgi:transposase
MNGQKARETTPRDLRGAIRYLIGGIRQVLAGFLAVVQRQELLELTRETRRLGSASAESVTHVGGQLRALDARLTRLEEDMAAVRKLLEDREGATRSAEPESEAAATVHGSG